MSFGSTLRGEVDLEGALETAATVWLPDRIDEPLMGLVGYPGGAYSRSCRRPRVV